MVVAVAVTFGPPSDARQVVGSSPDPLGGSGGGGASGPGPDGERI